MILCSRGVKIWFFEASSIMGTTLTIAVVLIRLCVAPHICTYPDTETVSRASTDATRAEPCGVSLGRAHACLKGPSTWDAKFVRVVLNQPPYTNSSPDMDGLPSQRFAAINYRDVELLRQRVATQHATPTRIGSSTNELTMVAYPQMYQYMHREGMWSMLFELVTLNNIAVDHCSPCKTWRIKRFLMSVNQTTQSLKLRQEASFKDCTEHSAS
jgi:hypothetical protein